MPGNAIKNWDKLFDNKNHYCSSICLRFLVASSLRTSEPMTANVCNKFMLKRLQRRFLFVHINWVKLKLVLLRGFEFSIFLNFFCHERKVKSIECFHSRC